MDDGSTNEINWGINMKHLKSITNAEPEKSGETAQEVVHSRPSDCYILIFERRKHDMKKKAVKPTKKEISEMAIYASFGLAFWTWFKEKYGDGEYVFDAESEEVLELALQYGLTRREKYDPEKHGEVEDAEPGQEIWCWGKA